MKIYRQKTDVLNNESGRWRVNEWVGRVKSDNLKNERIRVYLEERERQVRKLLEDTKMPNRSKGNKQKKGNQLLISSASMISLKMSIWMSERKIDLDTSYHPLHLLVEVHNIYLFGRTSEPHKLISTTSGRKILTETY